MTHRRAFTLIELLVVVAIIAALISILLPSMSKAREVSRRAACGSNQKQLQLAATTYAFSNKNRYQPLHRMGYTSTGVDHVSWISDDVFDYHLDSVQINLLVFACPNRGEEFIKQNADTYRIGYYMIYGRNESIWTFAPYERWESPQSMTDPGDGIMTGDIIERGTFTPPVATASHGPLGLVSGAQYEHPDQIKSVGGNFSMVDGSVHWRAQDKLLERSASRDALVRGFW